MDSPAKRPSSKKKSKKDKKRKSESIAVASPTSPKVINGAKHSASGSSGKNKKRRKEKKKPKRESNGGSADDERGMEREQKTPAAAAAAAAADVNESPPSAAEVEEMASQTQQAGIQQPPTSGPGALLSVTSAKLTTSPLKTSPYRTKTLVGTAALLPSSVADVPARINALLHSLLLTYDATLGGVLLSLEEEVKLLPVDDGKSGGGDNSGGGGLVGGRILDDLPYLHYRFSATGLVFCPTVGMRLKGQVVDCTPTYITLTTHHILSTKIFADRLKEVGFFYSEGSNEWTRERDVRSNAGEMEEEAGEGALLGPSTSIYLDDSVEFVVDRIHECGGYISLDGARPSVSTLG